MNTLSELRQLDPNGDVTVILHPSLSPQDKTAEPSSPKYEEDEDPTQDEYLERHLRDDRTGSAKDDQRSEDDGTETNFTGEAVREVRALLSSKAMSLASPVFRNMLNGRLKEAEILRSAGEVTIDLPDDDQNAFLILMNIAHLRFSEVPYDLDQEALVEIARLVDKYEMHRIVEPYKLNWTIQMQTRLKELDEDVLSLQLPEPSFPNIASVIFVLWALRQGGYGFQEVTKHAIQWQEGQLEDENLPIPPQLLGK